MNCPTCGTCMVAEVELIGGCNGHPEGCRCYCDSPDVTVSFVCVNAKEWVDTVKQLKNSTQHGWRRNPSRCKQKPVRIITDKYALERYFNEAYAPPKDLQWNT